eukprot:1137441-Pelagomonas_calceolata.AAC.2
MDDVLTKNTLQVVHVYLGSGAYSCSKPLSIRHAVYGCQNLEIAYVKEGYACQVRPRALRRGHLS